MDDTVVGVFDRERLSEGLVALHRGGLGPHARVLDPARGDLGGQLQRLGVAAPLAAEDQAVGTALIVVNAPGRGAKVVDALMRAGARAVRRVARDGAGFGVATPVAAVSARTRSGRRPGGAGEGRVPAAPPVPPVPPGDANGGEDRATWATSTDAAGDEATAP